MSPEVRTFIRRMSRENPQWGALHLRGELQMLGIDISQTTVAKYMIRHRKPPSQTWRTFLDNHAKDLVSIDFFTIPTVTFRILYVLLVLRHWRRQVVHFNVTERPTAQWTAQQTVEAFPWDEVPRYLLRDRDNVYGATFGRRVHSLIGSIRRECLDHVIVLNERHLKRFLRTYFFYYHAGRTHLALEKQCTDPRRLITLYDSPAEH